MGLVLLRRRGLLPLSSCSSSRCGGGRRSSSILIAARNAKKVDASAAALDGERLAAAQQHVRNAVPLRRRRDRAAVAHRAEAVRPQRPFISGNERAAEELRASVGGRHKVGLGFEHFCVCLQIPQRQRPILGGRRHQELLGVEGN